MIKDSGTRREFSTGAVRDAEANKGRMDLLPWAAIMEVSKHCEAGAVKYGEHNVDRGLPTHSFCDSGARHLAKYLDGWTDEPHLLAAAWNLLWAIQMEIKHPELVDTPFEKKAECDGGKYFEDFIKDCKENGVDLCYVCKNNPNAFNCEKSCSDCYEKCVCNSCLDGSKWEWKGVSNET